jgi:hypothetical protein
MTSEREREREREKYIHPLYNLLPELNTAGLLSDTSYTNIWNGKFSPNIWLSKLTTNNKQVLKALGAFRGLKALIGFNTTHSTSRCACHHQISRVK